MSHKLSDIPLGTCCRCNVKQINPGCEGFWINGMSNKWACYDCKYGKYGSEILSRPFGCEWCSYSTPKWMQGGYKCQRCEYLKIGQAEVSN